MTDLSTVETIVFLMLENRSFDHVLGHLSHPSFGNRPEVNGLREPLQAPQYENRFQGDRYYPFVLRDGLLSTDLPHGRAEVAQQLARNELSGRCEMNGFVRAYFASAANRRLDDTTKPDPMGFLHPDYLPVTGFFADQFAVCDQWFASLPTSTQPNRIMSLCGSSRIDETHGLFPPLDPMVIDWLDEHRVRWRVYHCGLSFFALLGRSEIFGPNFRGLNRLAPDVAHERPTDFPQVIIVEPSYGDAPHIGGDLPNDNHPPLAMAPGEALLLRVYQALTRNPERWSKTVLIVTYDEHGGFYDHVAPPAIPYVPAGNATFKVPFASLGVRVPGLVVSPLVQPRTVYHGTLDHTSLLQLLAEKFTPGTAYSPRVEERQRAGITSVSAVLNLPAPRTRIPAPPDAPLVATVTLSGPQAAETTPLQQAFQEAARHMVEEFPRQTAQQYPEVSHWVLTEGRT